MSCISRISEEDGEESFRDLEMSPGQAWHPNLSACQKMLRKKKHFPQSEKIPCSLTADQRANHSLPLQVDVLFTFLTLMSHFWYAHSLDPQMGKAKEKGVIPTSTTKFRAAKTSLRIYGYWHVNARGQCKLFRFFHSPHQVDETRSTIFLKTKKKRFSARKGKQIQWAIRTFGVEENSKTPLSGEARNKGVSAKSREEEQ